MESITCSSLLCKVILSTKSNISCSQCEGAFNSEEGWTLALALPALLDHQRFLHFVLAINQVYFTIEINMHWAILSTKSNISCSQCEGAFNSEDSIDISSSTLLTKVLGKCYLTMEIITCSSLLYMVILSAGHFVNQFQHFMQLV